MSTKLIEAPDTTGLGGRSDETTGPNGALFGPAQHRSAATIPGVEVTRIRLSRVDVTRVIVTAEIVAGAVAVAYRLARRPSAPKATVTMGPGGWVSMKGGTVSVRPARRPLGRPRAVGPTKPDARAPLWARVISAVPLQTLAR